MVLEWDLYFLKSKQIFQLKKLYHQFYPVMGMTVTHSSSSRPSFRWDCNHLAIAFLNCSKSGKAYSGQKWLFLLCHAIVYFTVSPLWRLSTYRPTLNAPFTFASLPFNFYKCLGWLWVRSCRSTDRCFLLISCQGITVIANYNLWIDGRFLLVV